MGFIFFLLFVCSIIALICYISNYNSGNAAAVGFCICLTLSAVIMFITWADSYGSTVIMQERLTSIDQYAHTVRVYSKHGVAEFKENSAARPELTDLKYQNYQNQIGDMITDLRDQINKYNNKLVGKNLMGKNWFWNWCIIDAPEGSVILKMSNYIE